MCDPLGVTASYATPCYKMGLVDVTVGVLGGCQKR
jgi:hypothetical protein